jgi:hypothetical protein
MGGSDMDSDRDMDWASDMGGSEYRTKKPLRGGIRESEQYCVLHYVNMKNVYGRIGWNQSGCDRPSRACTFSLM